MKKKQKKKTTISLLRFPGTMLQKQINTDEPLLSGYYICFCPIQNDSIDCFPMAKPVIALWEDGWTFQTNAGIKKLVLGWIGPLPNLSTDELQDIEPNQASLYLFYIGTKEQAANFEFKKGPYYKLIKASLQKGKKGDCIFLVNSRKTMPVIVSRWDENSEAPIKWVKDKKTEIMNKLYFVKNTKQPKKRKAIKMKRN